MRRWVWALQGGGRASPLVPPEPAGKEAILAWGLMVPFWRASSGGLHLSGRGDHHAGSSEGMVLASVTASYLCQAECQSQNDTSFGPLPHVF